MTLELIFGVEMGFPFYAKVESFCLLAAMMMMMRSVCVSLDPASKISLSLTIFEALVKNPKRGKKKKKKKPEENPNFACLFAFFTVAKKKRKVHGREREREKLLQT
jgi:predicted RNA-binding protein with RPS1 domain